MGNSRIRRRLKTLMQLLAALAFVAAVLYVRAFRPWQVRWGATDGEVGRSMPGDELLKAALILVGHDRDDLVIPVGESRRLASALSARAGATYTEYGMFQHADPTKRKLSPLRLVRELRGFYLSLYPMFRQAAA
jgi:hypothetical protein